MTAAQLISWSLFVENEEVILRESEYIFDMRGGSTFPNVGQAMVEVLERYGCETVLPTSQTCCGQPTYNSGYVTESTTTLKNQIDSFDGADYVVGPAGSCVGMMKEYHKF